MLLELDIKNEADRLKLQKLAKALCDFKRIEILKLIGEDKEFNYGELAKEIQRSPTSITNHLNWIREGEIIEDLLIEGKRGKMQKIPKLKITEIKIKLK